MARALRWLWDSSGWKCLQPDQSRLGLGPEEVCLSIYCATNQKIVFGTCLAEERTAWGNPVR